MSCDDVGNIMDAAGDDAGCNDYLDDVYHDNEDNDHDCDSNDHHNDDDDDDYYDSDDYVTGDDGDNKN